MRSPASAATRLALFYGVVFGLVGVRLPHFPGWLEGRDLDPSEIGLLLGLGPLTNLALSAAFGQAADRMRDERPLMAALGLGGAILYALFPLADGFAAYLVLSLGASVAMVPMPALADAMAIRLSRRGELDYGRTRLAGSLGFVVVSVALGRALERAPEDAVIHALAASSLAIAIVSIALPRVPRTPDEEHAASRSSALALLRRSDVRRLLLCTGFLQLGHAALYGIGSLHFERLGCSEETIGLLWAEGVIVEIAVFATTKGIVRRVSSSTLLVAGALGGLVRWVLLATAGDLPALVVAQSLHGLSFAAMHLGAMTFIERSVRETNTATGLQSALGVGLPLALGMPLAGALFEAYGGRAYLASALAAIIGLAFAVSLGRDRPAHEIAMPTRPERAA